MPRSRRPLLSILLVAPWLGEAVTTSTPALDLLLPWNLAFMVALYGSGALLCREVARRYGLGLPGLALLGAAYGVWEEALVDRYWFSPTFWDHMDVGTYSVLAGTNVLVAVHLTIFHSAVSISSSVLIVEHMFPGDRTRPWVGSKGAAVAAVTLILVVPFIYGEFDDLPATWLLVAAAGLCLALIAAAFVAPRPADRPSSTKQGSRWLGWLVGFLTSAHILLVYAVAQTTTPWPLGLAIAVFPVVVGVLTVRSLGSGDPYGPDAVVIIIGLLAYHLIVGVLVGLGGRFDITVAAVITAVALRRLHRQRRVGQSGTSRPGA